MAHTAVAAAVVALTTKAVPPTSSSSLSRVADWSGIEQHTCLPLRPCPPPSSLPVVRLSVRGRCAERCGGTEKRQAAYHRAPGKTRPFAMAKKGALRLHHSCCDNHLTELRSPSPLGSLSPSSFSEIGPLCPFSLIHVAVAACSAHRVPPLACDSGAPAAGALVVAVTNNSTQPSAPDPSIRGRCGREQRGSQQYIGSPTSQHHAHRDVYAGEADARVCARGADDPERVRVSGGGAPVCTVFTSN